MQSPKPGECFVFGLCDFLFENSCLVYMLLDTLKDEYASPNRGRARATEGLIGRPTKPLIGRPIN